MIALRSEGEVLQRKMVGIERGLFLLESEDAAKDQIGQTVNAVALLDLIDNRLGDHIYISIAFFRVEKGRV